MKFLQSFKHNDRDRIVQEGLTKDDCVELRIDLVCCEDAENGNGISCTEGSTHAQCFYERNWN